MGGGRERRSDVRYAVDADATVLLLNRLQPWRCRLVELCLKGCRIHSRDRIHVSEGMGVEISFKVKGIAFRFSGAVQWTDGSHEAGLYFSNRIPRQTEKLSIVLAEVEADAQKKAAQNQGVEVAGPELARPRPPASLPAADQPATNAPASPSSSPIRPGRLGRERRAQARESVDTAAVIYLVKGGSRFDGRILDLSLGGCCIRIGERFPLGIYTRVEVEFRLEGLPFRLAGVIQTLRDRYTVGIHFVDMSPRKQLQVSELMAEIHAMQEAKPAAGGDRAPVT